MKPKTVAALGLAALLALAPIPAAFAQDAPQQGTPAVPEAPAGEVPSVAEEDTASVSPFLPGEQTIGLSAGVHIPLFIYPDTRTVDETKLKTGVSFSFAYQYFVATGLAIGGTIGGAVNGTIGGRSYFVAPLSFRTAYWWTLLPFEFDVAVEAGGFLSRVGDYGMLGPFAKAGGGAYWRSASSWSVGLQAYFWLVPEIHYGEYTDLTRTSGFLEVSATAVYHL